jgi:hypothetical protein
VNQVRVVASIIVAAFIIASGNSLAAEWQSLGKTDDGNSETFVDHSTITVIGSIRSARFRYVPRHHLDRYKAAWIERSEASSEYDCNKSTTHGIELILYLEGGDTHAVPQSAAWESVQAPWDQVALKFLCAWQGD